MIERVLVITNTMDAGGAETFLMKLFRTLDKNKFVFDFLINKKGPCYYKEEIKNLGGKLYYGVSKSKNPIKCFHTIRKNVSDNKYKAVFIVAVHPLCTADIIAAKMGGAKIILTRSTNSGIGKGIISDFFAFVLKPIVTALSTVCLAPSTEAGIWLFGKKAVKKEKFHIINNGVELDKFIYSDAERQAIRNEFNIPDNSFLVGHVGRFNKVKNHKFILEVFERILSEKEGSYLLLIGAGELLEETKKAANEKGISDRVIFGGIRSDVPKILMGLDVLIFPSFYEGLPNVVIEAQAASLPCVISDTISKEVVLTDFVKTISLDAPISEWANEAIKFCGFKRCDMTKLISDKGYNIEKTTEIICNFLSGNV